MLFDFVDGVGRWDDGFIVDEFVVWLFVWKGDFFFVVDFEGFDEFEDFVLVFVDFGWVVDDGFYDVFVVDDEDSFSGYGGVVGYYVEFVGEFIVVVGYDWEGYFFVEVFFDLFYLFDVVEDLVNVEFDGFDVEFFELVNFFLYGVEFGCIDWGEVSWVVE